MSYDKKIMVHTKPDLIVMLKRTEMTFKDRPQLPPVVIKASEGYFESSRRNSVTPPGRQQCRQLPVIIYLFCATDEPDVHFRTSRTELRRNPPSPMLPSLTPGAGCSIPGIMIIGNQQTPWIARQRRATQHIMAHDP